MMSEKYNINRYQNVEAILILHYCVIHHTLKYTLGLGTVQGSKFPFIMQKMLILPSLWEKIYPLYSTRNKNCASLTSKALQRITTKVPKRKKCRSHSKIPLLNTQRRNAL